MPVIKSAQKAMRGSARKRAKNLLTKQVYKKAVKEARTTQNEATLKTAYKALDKAAKARVINKNKASRLKSRLSKTPSA